METQGRQTEEAESFRALSRRIKSLGTKSSPMVEDFDKALASLTAALSAGRKLEKCVLDDVAKVIREFDEAIREIDDLIERTDHSSISQPEPDAHKEAKVSELEKIISKCIQQIHDHTAPFIKGKEIIDKEKEKVDGTQSFEDELPERWLETEVNKVKGKLQVNSLKMRYNKLDPLLRWCSLFLFVFPGDAVISKRSIIYRWIGEGLIKPNKSQTAEQAGEQCFEKLLLSGLILPISKKHDKKPRYCLFPSSVKRMLEEVLGTKAKEVCLYFKTYDKKVLTAKDDKDNERPLSCLSATREEQSVIISSVSSKHKTSELLSLFNINAQYLKCESDKFSKFKSIKVMQLGKWQISSGCHIEAADTKFLESLGTMKDLRYLSLQGISRIPMLPDSLERLTNLQILDLRACHNLEALPTGIGSLKNLTHLDVSECSLLDRMPKGLSSLSELQVLKGFIISRNITSDPCRLKELAVLTNLRKLTINIAGGAIANDDLKELKAFGTLSSLTITWGKVTETSPLQSVSLRKLEKLDLQCIPLHEKLKWLTPGGFPNLKKLYIRGGGLESLINLGTNAEKWNVETLRLKYLSNLECNHWSDIEKTFSSLARVEIYKCPKLIEKLPSHHPEDTFWIKNGESWIPIKD
ncbi:disease resistance RPP13-like protein 4 [Cinnamomum micranthum f. kanehirae]|uniref:Disease resistance RPP13-like protein 4 n=1 Tax=Cinnamomum micranthum f. kanehirae TaxID=337451 RepID=A0A443PLW7_9MAGN|nr:disease resistance RPP13-like protein 4 [Cinnamomum micranthum f. kanehirae]